MRSTPKINRDRFAWLEDRAVRRQLAAVERLIADVAASGTSSDMAWSLRTTTAADPPRPIHHQLLSTRSKRLRAALLLLTARFGGPGPVDQLVRAAAAIEQVHEATLYHDDIVDRSVTRRGELSVQAAFGPAVAAFAGSELLYASARLCSGMPGTVRDEIARTAAVLCQGQVREVEATGDQRLSVRRRVEIMLQKTAVLFRLSARVAVVLARVPPSSARCLERYASRYGLCFQLADDLHDLCGGSPLLGRAPWQDLRDGVYTLPTLLALRADASKSGDLSRMLRALQEHSDEALVAQAAACIVENGAPEARTILAMWTERARAELSRLTVRRPTARRSIESLMATLVEQHPPEHPTNLCGA